MFDLGGSRVDIDPPLVVRDADPSGIETRSDQPVLDFGNGVLVGSEVFNYALRGPVLAKGRRVGVRNRHEKLLELVHILLG